MPFRDDPILRVGYLDGEWVLDRRLRYVSPDGEMITVPAGFVTDLASIPRVFHALIPINGRHRAAAILHDWLYETQSRSRAESDRLFLDAMADSRVRWSQRWAMYLAVRAAGWMVWSGRAYNIAEDYMEP